MEIEDMSPALGGLVRLSWSVRESFSADVPEHRLTALADLDPIRRPDGSLDLASLTDKVRERGLDGVLADLECQATSRGVQQRDVAEAYLLTAENIATGDQAAGRR
ncbi:hypothetical protein [Asanoa siamensis]|uniref:Uncharacterized protein n=1 Tax=Asanoa siamensis TaxID=926357 RepID=A0ABQ4D3K0_9ACTN|nr:hypothetical protein [Asanoa siamensis]GIF78108.1 hypothetical protein Asi02nite_76260 [Asanoa siamensis]